METIIGVLILSFPILFSIWLLYMTMDIICDKLIYNKYWFKCKIIIPKQDYSNSCDNMWEEKKEFFNKIDEYFK